jgi:hypothetical protein
MSLEETLGAFQDPRYSVLSVHCAAPDCVVKAAHKALAFELYPDPNHGANGEKIKQTELPLPIDFQGASLVMRMGLLPIDRTALAFQEAARKFHAGLTPACIERYGVIPDEYPTESQERNAHYEGSCLSQGYPSAGGGTTAPSRGEPGRNGFAQVARTAGQASEAQR